MRAPFILYKRAAGAKGKTYYVAFWDEEKYDYGHRRTTGQTSRAAAEAAARRMLEDGINPGRGKMTPLLPYLEAYWGPDGEHARDCSARGRNLSAQYLKDMKTIVRTHVRPWLEAAGRERITIDRISPADIESLLLGLRAKGILSPTTINNVRNAIVGPLDVAVRHGLLKDNPARRVLPLAKAEHERVRGILSLDEVRALFLAPWPNPTYQAINLLAATTGMRLGECLGLQGEDIRGDYIHVCHNWQWAEGIKAPKRGSIRDVPLPLMTRNALESLLGCNPHGDDLVFWGRLPGRPISRCLVLESLGAAMERIGISPAERKRRNLTFHSWRHWYNSMLRGRIDDHALRALTGHKSGTMTDRYSHVTDEQRAAVLKLAGKLVESSIPS